ncbi:M23 family metallopeptidase [Cryobacterium psychrophilum]|uniref:M23 family metallopeptidase n=1 Tax=Cryobacterium psychrophilum TaxID=41988 RepID=A0A4Y8KRB1_9MICO|nr:M23 family metallopeptidase [Cryobacterium psychrophilum]TDW31030.1 peptidase M23-like protein [Cryobacterium psychrophilum]TFD80882.1 M23 family metallopeptidase [Cryobacterium psychrophilum]
MGIIDNFTHPVILVDDRDPETSWANHLKRGSSGGVDLAYPYGSEVRAPADGVFQYFDGNGRVGKGSGGNIGRLRLPNQDYIEFMHLSSGSPDRDVKTGDLLGRSGASGFGNLWHYGPHLHVHIYIGGVRRNLFHYFTATSSAAASSSSVTITPAAAEPAGRKRNMYITKDTNGTILLATDQGFWGLPTTAYVALFERMIEADRTGVGEVFNPQQIGMMDTMLRNIVRSNVAQPVVQTVDAGAVAKAVIDALAPQIGNVVVDQVAIAKAVDAVLADNFAAIPGAVVGGLKAAL